MSTNTTINKKNYYRLSKTIGHKPDGTPIRKSFYGKSKKDAENKYDDYIREQTRLKYERKLAKDYKPFGERADEYIENALKVSQRYTSGTKRRYEMAYNKHIKGCFLSKLPASQVTSSDIQTFYNGLDVSMSTMRQINKFMSAFYKWLVLNEYATNVLDAVELPVKKDTSKNDIIIWEDSEIKTILESLKSPHRQFFMVYTLLYTGMRISEVLGLKYGDIRGGMIHVERQYFLGEIKEPKYGSKRIIPMHEELKKAFQIHKKWHREEMKKNNYKTDFIFTTSTGNLYSDSSVRHALNRFYKKHGLPQKKIHAYRSTFCTQLCRCGVQLEVASKLLGHKSLDVTAKHYAFIRPETKFEAIEALHFVV